jgi:antirestriction protein
VKFSKGSTVKGGIKKLVHNQKQMTLKDFWSKNNNKKIYFVQEDTEEGTFEVGSQTKDQYEDSQYWEMEGTYDDYDEAIAEAKRLAKNENSPNSIYVNGKNIHGLRYGNGGGVAVSSESGLAVGTNADLLMNQQNLQYAKGGKVLGKIANITFTRGRGRGMVKDVYFKNDYMPKHYISYSNNIEEINEDLKSWSKIHKMDFNQIERVHFAKGGGIEGEAEYRVSGYVILEEGGRRQNINMIVSAESEREAKQEAMNRIEDDYGTIDGSNIDAELLEYAKGSTVKGGGKAVADSKTKIEIKIDEEGRKIATRKLVKANSKGEKVTYELTVGLHEGRKRGWFELYATDEEGEEYFYSEGGLWIEGGKITDYDGVYELSEKLKPLMSALNLNSVDVYEEGGSILAKGSTVEGNEFYVGQSIMLDDKLPHFRRLTKDIQRLVRPYYNVELVIEEIIPNKPYNFAKTFVKSSGKKVPFEIKLNEKYIQKFAKGSTVKGGDYKFGYDITLKEHTSKNGTDIELRQNPKTKYYTIFINGFGGTSTPTEFLHVAEDDYKYELSKYEWAEKRGVFAKGSTVKGKKTAEEIYEEEQYNAMFNSEYANGGGVGSDETPKVWVGEWSLYNEGKLIGEWVDLSDYSSGEEVMDKIQELLDKWTEETGENREEYGIFDFENFPRSMYSEQMGEQDFDNVIKAWEFSQDRDVPMEVIGNIVREYEPSDLEEWFNEHYEGQFNSDSDLAYHYVDVLGGIEQLGKDTTERYFDYESFGRDLAYDYNNYDGHYFRSYKRGGNINKFDLKNYLTKGGFNYTIGGL